MNAKNTCNLAVGAALSILAMSANADSVANITSITGVWGPVIGGANVTGIGSPSISWGDGFVPDSGYDFIASATPINGIVPNGPTFDLGDFVHRNQPIPAGTAITGAQLNLAVAGTLTNGGVTPFSVNSVFQFTHNETTNATPCLPGSISTCDDVVTAVLNTGASTSVTILGTEYFFSIEGFTYGGSTFTQFLTQEGADNSAELVGAFTSKPTVVPIPAAAWLFGSALFGMAGIGYRRGQKA
jgi:hypothetical protein